MQVTVKQLSELLKVEYGIAGSLMNLMVFKGAAKEVGKQPPKSGKGKPSTIFEIPPQFTISLQSPVGSQQG